MADSDFRAIFEQLASKKVEEILGDVAETVKVDAAALSQRSNFGKCVIGVAFKVRPARGETYAEVEKAVFDKSPAINRLIEVRFYVDTAEFSARAAAEGWTYERKISAIGDDWQKFCASLADALIEYDTEKYTPLAADIRKSGMSYVGLLHTKYVEMVDVPQSRPARDGKTYKTPTVGHIFKSREEALAAYNTKFKIEDTPASDEYFGGGDADCPPGWSKADWESVIPALKEEVASGKSKKQVADEYGIPVTFVITATK